MTGRKNEAESKLRGINVTVDDLKNQAFLREDQLANIARERDNLKRQFKFMENDNEKLNINLSDSDAKRN